MKSIIIREIKKEDNSSIAFVIRKVLEELNVPKIGTAYADPHLDYLFETYLDSKSIYYVIEKDLKIVGGAGIMQLENENSTICELQKMYILSDIRGLGLGFKLIEKCLNISTNSS